MWQTVLAWVDSTVPGQLGRDEARRARATVVLALALGPWSPLIAGILWMLGAHMPAAAIGLIGAICALVPQLVKRNRPSLASHLLVFGLLQGLVVSAALLGGVGSPPTQWVVLVPLLATATGGVRAGIGWCGVVIACTLSLHGYQLAGMVEIPYLVDGWLWLGTVSAVGLYVVVGLFLGSNDALYRSLIARVEEAEAAERQANQAKSGFLANMSHEIRTPLNAILGYTEMVSEEAQDLGQTEMVTDLGRVRRSGSHLLDLVNDILDLSKIEAGKLEIAPEPLSLEPLLAELSEELGPLLAERGNTLVARVDGIWVVADRGRLRQCIINLLSNASKFTESGVIVVEAERQEPVVIRVIDEGIGMTPEQAARVFDPFAQATAKTSEVYGGTGLGLAIVQRLIQSMGGEVTVTSQLGEGTTFRLTLPSADGGG